LRLCGVAGLVEHLGVQPTDNRSGATEPQRIIPIIAKL
jgi:hypothetical protein